MALLLRWCPVPLQWCTSRLPGVRHFPDRNSGNRLSWQCLWQSCPLLLLRLKVCWSLQSQLPRHWSSLSASGRRWKCSSHCRFCGPSGLRSCVLRCQNSTRYLHRRCLSWWFPAESIRFFWRRHPPRRGSRSVRPAPEARSASVRPRRNSRFFRWCSSIWQLQSCRPCQNRARSRRPENPGCHSWSHFQPKPIGSLPCAPHRWRNSHRLSDW